MAKIFLDGNAFFDILESRKKIGFDSFVGHQLFISPLSLHIYLYVYGYPIPSERLQHAFQYITLVSFNEGVVFAAALGPLGDFEDNVQLHSAMSSDCDLFITSDKKLLTLKTFGKMKIIKELK